MLANWASKSIVLALLVGCATWDASFGSAAGQEVEIVYNGPLHGIHGEAHIVAALQLTDLAYHSPRMEPVLAKSIAQHIQLAKDAICDRRADRQLRQADDDLCDYLEDAERDELINVARNLRHALDIEHRLHAQAAAPVVVAPRPYIARRPLLNRPLLDRPVLRGKFLDGAGLGQILDSGMLQGLTEGDMQQLDGRRMAAAAARALADHLDEQADIREGAPGEIVGDVVPSEINSAGGPELRPEELGSVPHTADVEADRAPAPRGEIGESWDPNVYLGEADTGSGTSARKPQPSKAPQSSGAHRGSSAPHMADTQADASGLTLEPLPNGEGAPAKGAPVSEIPKLLKRKTAQKE